MAKKAILPYMTPDTISGTVQITKYDEKSGFLENFS